jgi:hypothetical protein
LFRQEIVIKEVGSTNLDIQTSAFQDMEMATNDELTSEVRALLTTEPLRHVTYTREYLGWGVFALMPR